MILYRKTMQKYRVIWTDPARDDLRMVYDFIARDSDYYADKVTREIYEWSKSVFSVAPHIGRIVQEEYTIREITEPYYGYKIRHQIVGDSVYVLMVYKWQNRPL